MTDGRFHADSFFPLLTEARRQELWAENHADGTKVWGPDGMRLPWVDPIDVALKARRAKRLAALRAPTPSKAKKAPLSIVRGGLVGVFVERAEAYVENFERIPLKAV